MRARVCVRVCVCVGVRVTWRSFYQGLHMEALSFFRDMSTTCRSPVEVASTLHPLLTIELGVSGIGYDEVVLPVGDGGGGGDEHDDDAEDEDDEDADDEDEDVSVLSVNGVAGDVVATVTGPVGWIELSLWPRWVMRLAPRVTSRPGVAAKHRDTSEAQRV